VVDGSNLATEGRTLPSLAQLDEAVRAYAEEDPNGQIIVVVDASFEHRIDESERDPVRDAMLAGEIVSPPAGAIGRGDAFVLRIAERTGAVVLSNDSFQEFHGEHPWLFDDGRLVGGKPVPGVGWIFTPRLPIRGPKSRAATAAEKRTKSDAASAPAKAAELRKAAKKSERRSSKKSDPAVETSWPLTPTAPPPRGAVADPEVSTAISEAVAEALDPKPPKKENVAKKGSEAKKSGGTKKASAAKKGTKSDRQSQPAAPSSRDRDRGRSATPPPAVNEPLAFIHFVAAFQVGSTVEGEVMSFTSHGAMVDVALPEGGHLHCYIPLSAMGSPAPTKARQVLAKGEVRSFVLDSLDPPRRVAELALPDSTPHRTATTAATTAPVKKAPAKKSASSKKETPTQAQAPAKKAAAKKPPAKQAPTKKKAAPAELVKKARAKKSTTPKAETPKQSPRKKAAPQKSPSHEAPPQNLPAKKAAPAKAPSKNARAKKAPPKKAARPTS
jgi:hypothetical protein